MFQAYLSEYLILQVETFLVPTVHTCTYHPCMHEGLAMSSVAILICQSWG